MLTVRWRLLFFLLIPALCLAQAKSPAVSAGKPAAKAVRRPSQAQQIKALTEQNAQLAKDNEVLGSGVEALLAANAALKEQLEEVKKAAQNIIGLDKGLVAEYNRLLAKHNSMVADYNSLVVAHNSMRSKGAALQAQINADAAANRRFQNALLWQALAQSFNRPVQQYPVYQPPPFRLPTAPVRLQMDCTTHRIGQFTYTNCS